jgi:hypothetical protein
MCILGNKCVDLGDGRAGGLESYPTLNLMGWVRGVCW